MEDRPLDEDELVSRARGGDEGAYGVLVGRYQQVAFRTAYLVIADSGEAEDATQEAFVNAYRALNRFRPGAPFRPWLLRIVANSARNRRRSGHRRASLSLRAAAEPMRAAESAESEVLAAEQRLELVKAVNALGPDDRLVIGARYFLDLPESEIAELLGVARGTVMSRLSRARDRLARVLAAGARVR